MTPPDVEIVAFSRPGGEASIPSPWRAKPVDLGHLARQTMGDRAVEQDVLAMFVQQALLVRERIVGATAEDRKQLAHGLKGSARGIGAFAIAECAAAIERSPADKRLMKELAARIDRACDFIAAISR